MDKSEQVNHQDQWRMVIILLMAACAAISAELLIRIVRSWS